MQFLPSFLIYSLDSNVNASNVKISPMQLPEHHTKVTGVYKGHKETSYVAPMSDKGMVMELAELTNQESVLKVENGAAFLVYVDTGASEYIGKWTEVADSKHLDAYTEYNGRIFAAI